MKKMRMHAIVSAGGYLVIGIIMIYLLSIGVISCSGH